MTLVAKSDYLPDDAPGFSITVYGVRDYETGGKLFKIAYMNNSMEAKHVTIKVAERGEDSDNGPIYREFKLVAAPGGLNDFTMTTTYKKFGVTFHQ